MLAFVRRGWIIGCALLALPLAAMAQQTILTYSSSPGDPVGQGVIFTAPNPQWTFTAQLVPTAEFVHVQMQDTTSSDSMSFDVAAPPGFLLDAGTYDAAARASIRGSSPGLAFRAHGRGCNQVLGTFTVLEIAFSAGVLQKLAVDFEQHCEVTGPPLYGVIRFNSFVPVTPFPPVCATFAQVTVDMDGDGSPDCTEVAEGIDPTVRDNDVFNNGRLFAQQLYRDFLGREGEELGVAYWASQSATVSHAQIISSFLHSAEFEQSMAPILRLYTGTFLRIPDSAGLRYWMQAYRSGMSITAMADQFAASAEFTTRYGALDTTAFVNLVYQNVLGRAPDAQGLIYWSGQIDGGALSRGSLLASLTNSPEYVALSNNEVLVAMVYMGMLRRTPENGGFAFWVGFLDAGNIDLALIDGVFHSAEYRARFF